jgi:uncharacterized protein YigE (DUF2233 family)
MQKLLAALLMAVAVAGLAARPGRSAETAPPLPAKGCHPTAADSGGYVVCAFDTRGADLRLFWRGADGAAYGNFAAVGEALRGHGERLAFAMNAGMYQPDLSPVGLYVERGHELKAANTRPGPGNFHMQPNGVVYFGPDGAGVMETQRYLKAGLQPAYASQSGPMLVIGGAIHPKIQPTGTSAKIRNGVGVRDGRWLIFAISDAPVTFHQFATFFRDALGCRDALYLDGSISSLYAPALGRADHWLPMGPIVGVVEKGE